MHYLRTLLFVGVMIVRRRPRSACSRINRALIVQEVVKIQLRRKDSYGSFTDALYNLFGLLVVIKLL